jgi:hypothetical protein
VPQRPVRPAGVPGIKVGCASDGSLAVRTRTPRPKRWRSE